MREFSANVAFDKATNGQTDIEHKNGETLSPMSLLNSIYAEGGSFSPTIFNSDIELSVFPISCFMSVCPFVDLSKATFAENSHIVLFSRY